jgi:zinc transporter
MKQNFIIEGWQIDANAVPSKIENGEQLQSHNYWVHCDRSSSEFEQWLKSLGLDESIIESLLANDTRPRFQQIDEQCFFLILRGVNLNPGKEPDDMLTVRLLYTPERVVTCSLQRLRAIEAVSAQLNAGKGPETLEYLVLEILNQLNCKIESVIEPIEKFIDSQDNDSFNSSEIAEISVQNRKLLRLNRFLKPQLYALSAMNKNIVSAFEEYEVNLANQLDTLSRIVDTIDFYIAQIDVINNRISQINSEVMNRNTYMLSIIAGIFLPLGFLTGLFGINVGGMPGVDNPNAFYWFCGVLTGIGVFALVMFRRWKFL